MLYADTIYYKDWINTIQIYFLYYLFVIKVYTCSLFNCIYFYGLHKFNSMFFGISHTQIPGINLFYHLVEIFLVNKLDLFNLSGRRGNTSSSSSSSREIDDGWIDTDRRTQSDTQTNKSVTNMTVYIVNDTGQDKNMV